MKISPLPTFLAVLEPSHLISQGSSYTLLVAIDLEKARLASTSHAIQVAACQRVSQASWWRAAADALSARRVPVFDFAKAERKVTRPALSGRGVVIFS